MLDPFPVLFVVVVVIVVVLVFAGAAEPDLPPESRDVIVRSRSALTSGRSKRATRPGL